MINLTVIKVSCVDHKFVSCKFSVPVQARNMYKIIKKNLYKFKSQRDFSETYTRRK